MRIVAALVNPVGPAPELETVTLLNSTPDSIDLTGWSVADRLKQRFALPAQSLAGRRHAPGGGAAAGRPRQQGWSDHAAGRPGLKVDGVAYTAADAPEGWTTVF